MISPPFPQRTIVSLCWVSTILNKNEGPVTRHRKLLYDFSVEEQNITSDFEIRFSKNVVVSK